MLFSTGFCAVTCSNINYYSKLGQNDHYTQTKKLLLLTFSTMIFFASMRSKVSDTAAYTILYERIPDSLSQLKEYAASQTKDKTFWVLSMIFKCVVSNNYHVWFFVITFICCTLISCTFARYSESPFLSAFMFMLSCNFTWLFNGMRQFLAASIIFYALRYIEEENFSKYLALCLVACAIHLSSVSCIPVYFIVKGKAGNKKVILSMLGAVLVLLCLSYLLPAADSALTGTDYDGIIAQFETDDGVNIIRTVIAIVPAVIFFVFKDKYKHDIPQYVNIAVNMSILTALINLIGKFTSGIYIGRMSIYFEMSGLYLYPWLFNAFFTFNRRKIIQVLYVSFYFLYYYYQMVITWAGFGYESDVLHIRFR